MSSGLKQLIITLILLIAAGFSSWLIIHYQLQRKEDTEKILDNPDFFAEKINILQMDQKGEINHQISIQHMVHYPLNNITYFIKPHILFLTLNQPAWLLTANHGRAVNGAEHINLWGNVQITQQDLKHNAAAWNLTTEALSYYPKQQLVITHRPVNLIGPGSRLFAKGLQLDLSQAYINFFNDTHDNPLPTH